jgi:hypothetical protein
MIQPPNQFEAVLAVELGMAWQGGKAVEMRFGLWLSEYVSISRFSSWSRPE